MTTPIDDLSPELVGQTLGKTRPWAEIHGGAVTARTADIDAISTGTVTASSVLSSSVNAGTVTADALTADSVTSDAITSGTVEADSVTSPAVNAGTVNADTVVAGSITDGVNSMTIGNLLGAATAVPPPYSLPVASELSLGGVKVDGSTITIDGDGTLRIVGGSLNSEGTTDHRELGYKNEPGQHASVALTHNGAALNVFLDGLETTLIGKLDSSSLSGYVTTAALAPYVTTNTLDGRLTSYVTTGTLDTRLSPYATTSALNTALSGKADASAVTAVNNALSAKADRTELPGLATSAAAGLLSAADKSRIDSLPDSFNTFPSGAGTNYLLQYSGGPVWSTPATVANSLPLMSASQKGVAKLSATGGLAIDANGLLSIKADNQVSKSSIDASIANHNTRLTSLESTSGGIGTLTTRVGTLETNVTTATTRLNGLDSLFGGLGAMAHVADVPADGKQYVRKNRQWTEFETPSSGGASGGGAILGEIRLLPFRKSDLPTGWYLCNGDRYALTSAQGATLNSLPALLKSDWSITTSGGNISLPNLFSGDAGYFMRPVNGSSRVPGSKQADAMRNITATFSWAATAGLALHGATLGTSEMTGAFYSPSATKKASGNGYNYGNGTVGDLHFDASRCVPVADEIRPINVGMTPAIYLGV